MKRLLLASTAAFSIFTQSTLLGNHGSEALKIGLLCTAATTFYDDVGNTINTASYTMGGIGALTFAAYVWLSRCR